MRIETRRLVDRIRHEDPHSMDLLDAMAEHLPAMVEHGDRYGDFPAELWQQLPVGVLNRINIPVQYGGLPGSATTLRRTVMLERIAYSCPGLPIGLPGPSLTVPPILSLGTEPQKKAFFERFLTDEKPVWGAFAITEPSVGSDATAIKTTAKADGDDYILNGEKCYITCGGRADVLVVFASINRDKGRFGIRAFLVTKDTPGFAVDRIDDMLGLRASQLAVLSFTDCRVSKYAMLGHVGKRGPLIDAFAGAAGAWDYMRPAIAALANGSCTSILDYAEALIRNGNTALSVQMMTDTLEQIQQLRARVKSSQVLTFKAAWRYDQGLRASTAASMAKAYSASLAMDIANFLCSRFPLHSITSGDRFEKFYRDARAFDIIEGTGDMQRLMIARAYQPLARGETETRRPVMQYAGGKQ